MSVAKAVLEQGTVRTLYTVKNFTPSVLNKLYRHGN